MDKHLERLTILAENTASIWGPETARTIISLKTQFEQNQITQTECIEKLETLISTVDQGASLYERGVIDDGVARIVASISE